jgi:hypothetical protein
VAEAATSSDMQLARADLQAWLSWARRCRLEPFKQLSKILTPHLDAVVRGMIDNRSNACVEAMNGLPTTGQARCARLQDSLQLHRHRLLAAVQAETPAGSSVPASRCDGKRSTNHVPRAMRVIVMGSWLRCASAAGGVRRASV